VGRREGPLIGTLHEAMQELSWSLKGWTVQSTVNYTGAYRDPGSVPVRKVDSWTTIDVNVGYRVDGGSSWLANTQFNLGINNALDQRPPSSTSLT
jgi:outer membrane receptor protein involved in Fe transport